LKSSPSPSFGGPRRVPGAKRDPNVRAYRLRAAGDAGRGPRSRSEDMSPPISSFRGIIVKGKCLLLATSSRVSLPPPSFPVSPPDDPNDRLVAPVLQLHFRLPFANLILLIISTTTEAVLRSILRLCLVVCERNWPPPPRPPPSRCTRFRHPSTFCLRPVASLLLGNRVDIHQPGCCLPPSFRIFPRHSAPSLDNGMTESTARH
jgi:hypothetical protein